MSECFETLHLVDYGCDLWVSDYEKWLNELWRCVCSNSRLLLISVTWVFLFYTTCAVLCSSCNSVTVSVSLVRLVSIMLVIVTVIRTQWQGWVTIMWPKHSEWWISGLLTGWMYDSIIFLYQCSISHLHCILPQSCRVTSISRSRPYNCDTSLGLRNSGRKILG